MSYVKYDDLGVVEILCMNCGATVASRTYRTIITKSIPPKEVNVMAVQRYTSFRRKRFDVDSHGYVEVMLCSNCINKTISPEKMERAIEAGWEDTWDYEHTSKELRKELRKTLPILKGSIMAEKKPEPEKDKLKWVIAE